MKFEATTVMNVAPEVVWARLIDLKTATRLVPLLEEAELLDPPPPKVGSRVRLVANVKGQRTATQAVVIALEEARRLALRAEVPEASVAMAVQWTLAPTAGGTEVRQRVELGFGSLLAQLGAQALLRDHLSAEAVERSLAILKADVEGVGSA